GRSWRAAGMSGGTPPGIGGRWMGRVSMAGALRRPRLSLSLRRPCSFGSHIPWRDLTDLDQESVAVGWIDGGGEPEPFPILAVTHPEDLEDRDAPIGRELEEPHLVLIRCPDGDGVPV